MTEFFGSWSFVIWAQAFAIAFLLGYASSAQKTVRRLQVAVTNYQDMVESLINQRNERSVHIQELQEELEVFRSARMKLSEYEDALAAQDIYEKIQP